MSKKKLLSSMTYLSRAHKKSIKGSRIGITRRLLGRVSPKEIGRKVSGDYSILYRIFVFFEYDSMLKIEIYGGLVSKG